MFLLDTNILVREVNVADAMHGIVRRGLAKLHDDGRMLCCISPQVLIEFRCVATRDIGLNGLGLLPNEADAASRRFQQLFDILPETAAIFPEWEAIVRQHGVVGKHVHDARLVAVCRVYRVPNILTFDFRGFQRYASSVAAVDPESI